MCAIEHVPSPPAVRASCYARMRRSAGSLGSHELSRLAGRGDLRLIYRLGGGTISTSTPNWAPADPPSSYRAIENLIARYAELVDDGDFAGVGILFADATFTGGAGSVRGRNAIEKMLRDSLIVYDDGTPRTKHVTTNLVIEVDEEAGTAVSRSYFTALQALGDLALQPIVSGRYHDRFARRDGQWHFVERRVRTDLVGDVSRHLRQAGADPSSRPDTHL
jgi:3-phenylpropionate/cinnamic acid dioxygenase small subunit